MKKAIFYAVALTLPFLCSLEAYVCNCFDLKAEARVAYYHPCSSKVRRIYGEGWADYQVEFSTKIDDNLRAYAGVSGFSREGRSIGFHDKTTLQLIPISLGLKYDFDIFPYTKAYLGGAACYSLLRIKDHSEYVHEHTRRQRWGGVIQSGISYSYCDWAIVSFFGDYFFQRFHFSDSHEHSRYANSYYYGSRFIKRETLNLDGYKVGVGLAVSF